MAHVLECSPDTLLTRTPSLTEAQKTRLQGLLAQYETGTPLTRLLGVREFWSLPFKLNEHTLDPRPDSETVIESVLKSFPNTAQPLRFLDLGTGTGCLGISLLSEYKNATATLVDISQEALNQAQENAQINGVSDRCIILQSNWFENINDPFDVLISNPPYIDEEVYESLDNTVKNFDPKRALTAPEKGLFEYRTILESLYNQNSPFLQGFFEIGFDQEEGLKTLLNQYGFTYLNTTHDLEQRPRVISFKPLG